MLVKLKYADPILMDDPVRPNIRWDARVSVYRCVFAWVEKRKLDAICCVSFQTNIPTKEKDLFLDTNGKLHFIMYSIWSYKKGAASKLIRSVRMLPTGNRIITLSPKTEMAENFHKKNGAKVLRRNKTTINYEYKK